MRISVKKVFGALLSFLIATSGMATIGMEEANAASVPFIKVFGGSAGDSFSSVQPTSDGGYIAVGGSSSTDGDLTGLKNKSNNDAILVKYDAYGNVTWKKIFGGTSDDSFTSVQQTSDGGYIAVGTAVSTDGDLSGIKTTDSTSYSDSIIVKFDASGNVVWKKIYGESYSDGYYSVQQTSDGGYIAVGEATTNLSAIVAKYDASGNVLWKKDVGGSSYDGFRSVQETNDGGYIAVGYTMSNNGDMTGITIKGGRDSFIMKFDASGNVKWVKNFGGSKDDYFNSVQQTTDGGYLVVGETASNDADVSGLNKGTAATGTAGTKDAILVKYDATGNVLWKKTFGGSSDDSFSSVQLTSDNGYIAVGSSYWFDYDLTGLTLRGYSDAIIVKFDASNNVVWKNSIGGTGYDSISSIKPTNDGGYIAAVSASSPIVGTVGKGNYDANLVKFASDGSVASVVSDTSPPTVSVSPSTTSPTNQNVTVSVTATDDVGVAQLKWAAGNQTASYFASAGTDITTTKSFAVSQNGAYTVWASDAAGNQTVQTITISNVDTTAPEQPNISVNGNQLTVTPGTDVSGIQKTEYQLNDGVWTTYSGVVILPDGSYTINARSTDNAGNVSSFATFTTTITVQAVADATAKVVTAEGSQKQVDVDIARSAVNALPAGQTKTDLSNRLNAVQATIDAYNALQAQIADATAKVVTAEGSQKQVDVDTARSAVNALPAGQTKTDLSNRLDAVQQAIDAYNALQAQIADATAKVVTAEGTQKQADVDTARNAVNALPAGQTKTDLSNRLDAVQQAIDAYNALQAQIADATAKVVTAEGSQKQADVDTARNAVNALPSGQTKTDLSNRLDAVQQAIDAYNALQAKIADATAKVVTAEGSQKQTDVDTARTAVNALPNGQTKTDLSNRLDAVQQAIDAKAKAQSIQDELNTMQGNLESGNFTLSDLDNYKDRLSQLVDEVLALPSGSTQDALLQQISDLSDLIDLIESVFAAESTGNVSSIDLNQLSNLPDSPLKDQLQQQVDAAQQMADSINEADGLVSKAETTKAQLDVDTARDAVNGLPDSQAKTDLENRLDVVQKQIDDALQAKIADATAKVVNAESSQKQADVDTAKTAVNALPNGQPKIDLLNRLSVVQNQIDVNNATALVAKLETSYAQADVTPAQNAVNGLPDSSEKTALQNRINVVINFLNDLSAATAKVVTAEATKTQTDVDAARSLVNALADRPEKTDLLNRLDAIQVGGQIVYTNINDIADPAVRSLLSDVDFYVTQAEKYFIRDNITLAKDKVVAIPTDISSDPRYAVIYQSLKDRTNYLITLYNQQLADAQLQTAINNATTAVANYEKYKTAYYKSRAQTAINALPDGAVKDGLQARFDAVV